MSSSITAYLLIANQKIVTYSGISIFTIGLFGGFFNTVVFLSLKTFRENSCAFYLTILSIVNISQLITSLLSRIMITGFNIDWTQNSLVYCKLRPFIFQSSSLISFICISLSTIDQYLSTCFRPSWQQWNNIKVARRIMIISILIAMITQTPCLIFYNHTNSISLNQTICTITNNDFLQINAYFNYLFIGNILPFLITFPFGLMAYRNTRKLTHRIIPIIRRQLDKQLTAIVILQVLYLNLALFPNTIMYLILSYGNIQNAVLHAHLRLIYAITTCFYYTYYASPFYINVCVSERFRRQLIYVLSKLLLNCCDQRRIYPHLQTVQS